MTQNRNSLKFKIFTNIEILMNNVHFILSLRTLTPVYGIYHEHPTDKWIFVLLKMWDKFRRPCDCTSLSFDLPLFWLLYKIEEET